MKYLLRMCFAIVAIVMIAGCTSSKTSASSSTRSSSSDHTTTYKPTHHAPGRRLGDPSTMIFHTEACPAVAGLAHAITFPSREDAIASGFTPDDTGQCDP